MSIVELKITDPEIKRQAILLGITELSDKSHPVRLRFHKSRLKASWFYVDYRDGTANWHKLGHWPAIPAKTLFKQLPELVVKLAGGEFPNLNDFTTISDLLIWFCDRSQRDRGLSDKRKCNIKSSINKHLIPRLGKQLISEITPALIDDELIRPLQTDYGIGTIKLHFAILKVAFKKAKTIKKIKSDPISDIKFNHFIEARIPIKASKLLPGNLPETLNQIAAAKVGPQMLTRLMLMLGTRIGETRQLRWQHFDIDNARLVIPETITKTVAHSLPLTESLINYLQVYASSQNNTCRSVYLFPNGKGRKSIDESQANDWVQSVSDRAWTAHDLRKLARTCWADLGVEWWIAERLLNHAISKLDAAYIHSTAERGKLASLGLWHEHLRRHIAVLDSKTTPRFPENNNNHQHPYSIS